LYVKKTRMWKSKTVKKAKDQKMGRNAKICVSEGGEKSVSFLSQWSSSGGRSRNRREKPGSEAKQKKQLQRRGFGDNDYPPP